MKKLSSLEFLNQSLKKIMKSSRPFQSHLPKGKEDSMIVDKLPAYFLLLTLVVALYFLFDILRPFLTVIFLAAVLTVTFHPMYRKILKVFRGYSGWASIVSCLIVVLVIIVPLASFVVMLTNEAVDTYYVVKSKVESGVFDEYLQWQQGGVFYDVKQNLDPFVNWEEIDIKEYIVNAAQVLSTFLFDQTANFLRSISSLLLNFFVMLFAMYYFFKDGEKLVKHLGRISPLPSLYEGELFRKMDSMVKAIMIGVFLTAVIQGIVGGVGFAIVGVSSPVFWGTAIAFFSLVPVVGTAAIWLPAAVVLAILGNYWEAVFMALWGMFAVGTVDNFVRPYLIGGKAKTYPLLTFFVILGGIFTMGLKGIIVGPLILMVVMSLLHIYEAEYGKVLKK